MTFTDKIYQVFAVNSMFDFALQKEPTPLKNLAGEDTFSSKKEAQQVADSYKENPALANPFLKDKELEEMKRKTIVVAERKTTIKIDQSAFTK